MGDLEKMQPRPCKRDFFTASRRKWASTPKLRATPGARTAVKEPSPLRGAPLAPRADQGTRVGSVVSTQMSEKQVKRTGGLNADIRGFAPDGTRIIRNSSSSRTARICAELRRAARARSCDEPGRSPFSIEHEKRTAPVSYRRAHFDHP